MMKDIIAEIENEINAEINELNAYYDEHIKGHKWDEVPEEWEHYAEWYKELFGRRPVPAELRKTA